MQRHIRQFSAAVILLIAAAACDEFPAFEGTYTGTAVITFQTYQYPAESDATVEINRDFKDITVSYSTVFGSFALGGRIDNNGDFTVIGSGTTDDGKAYSMTDEGNITLTTGDYESTLTIIEEGETTLIVNFSLTKR